MSIKRYGTPTKPGALPFSKAAGADGWLFVSGQVPRDADGEIVTGNITVQARVTLENLKKVLESAGYSLEDVVRVNVFLDDPRDFAGFNKVYAQFFTAEHAPARVCVQAMMMSDLRVEVDCVAYKKTKRDMRLEGKENLSEERLLPPQTPPLPLPRLS
ncbi:MAG: RidA family protein [Bilophila wadsworthia]